MGRGRACGRRPPARAGRSGSSRRSAARVRPAGLLSSSARSFASARSKSCPAAAGSRGPVSRGAGNWLLPQGQLLFKAQCYNWTAANTGLVKTQPPQRVFWVPRCPAWSLAAGLWFAGLPAQRRTLPASHARAGPRRGGAARLTGPCWPAARLPSLVLPARPASSRASDPSALCPEAPPPLSALRSWSFLSETCP